MTIEELEHEILLPPHCLGRKKKPTTKPPFRADLLEAACNVSLLQAMPKTKVSCATSLRAGAMAGLGGKAPRISGQNLVSL